jgi:hypothetical protein
VFDKENMERQKEELLTEMEKEKERFEQEILEKQKIESRTQELLIETEKQKKENINLKSQYDTDTQNFKNQLEEKQKQLDHMEN